MKMRSIQELICSSVVIAVGLVAFILTFNMPHPHYIFPRIASGALIIFGTALFITTIIGDKNQKAKAVNFLKLKSPFVVYVIIAAYVFLMPVLGFYVCTVLAMVGLMLYMRIHSVKAYIICIGVMIVFMFIVFTWQLDVPLPTGLLI
jgi:hypothetical protein